MWQSAWGAPGSAGHGYGHHRGPGWGAEADPDQRAAFRLPPKIEWMLDSWHTRAHQALEFDRFDGSSCLYGAPDLTEGPNDLIRAA